MKATKRLHDLKARRAELDDQIKAEADRQRKRSMARARAGKYAKTVCHECKGEGLEYDHRSPTVLGPCCTCAGHGFLWRRLWESKKNHDMDAEGKEGE